MHYGIILENFKSANRVIRFLVLTDLLLWGGWGFIGPVFALFVVAQITAATAATVGVAVGIYWIVKALVQIPVASYLDHTRGEKDDFYALLLSLMLAGFAAILFLLTENALGVFLVSALQGLAFGVYTPAWFGIFSRHLDPDRNAFDWALDSTTVGFAYGIAGIVGGALAATFGFEAVFIMASVFSFGSAILLFTIPDIIIPKPSSPPQVPESAPKK